jgi:SAM-dependent methyltransferase
MSADYVETNRLHWDEVVPHHVGSAFYDVAEFLRNPDSLTPIETTALGDVRGKTLLHLQCHFGMDTISWARRGAVATGVDFSAKAVAEAEHLAKEVGVSARFIASDVYDLAAVLPEQFDIVFTSYGVLTWLPDLTRWAQAAADRVRPGGVFYIAEFHPFAGIFDLEGGELVVRRPYFPEAGPQKLEGDGSYAHRSVQLVNRRTYEFPFTLGQVITALIRAGLQIDVVEELPYSPYQFLPFTREVAKHDVRMIQSQESVPLVFTVLAHKPS